MNIIILGPQGCGKGTQAEMIAERYGIPHISTGDMFRAAMEQGTDLGKQIKERMNKGILISDEITIKLVELRLKDTDCTETSKNIYQRCMSEIIRKIVFAKNVENLIITVLYSIMMIQEKKS